MYSDEQVPYRDNIVHCCSGKKDNNTMEGTTRLIVNEPSLEKSPIRDMIRNDVNKSTKMDIQRTLSTDLIMKSNRCELIT